MGLVRVAEPLAVKEILERTELLEELAHRSLHGIRGLLDHLLLIDEIDESLFTHARLPCKGNARNGRARWTTIDPPRPRSSVG